MWKGWRGRGEKKKVSESQSLLNCFKWVISVIRGKSIAQACSIKGNGDSLLLPLSVTSSLIISPLLPHVLLPRPVHLFSAARAEKGRHLSL